MKTDSFKTLPENILTVCGTLVICFLVLETLFTIRHYQNRVYPLTYFKTEIPGVSLWSYDRRLKSIPDWDLSKGIPYENISYAGNNDENPQWKDISYREVPLAIEIRTNEQGFRERPFEDIQAGNITLVIGDSFCFGQGVRSKDRFTSLLEKRLNRAGEPHTAFVNLCQPGAGITAIHKNLITGLAAFPQAKRILYVYTLNDPVTDTAKSTGKQKYINDLMHLRSGNMERLHPALAPLMKSHFLRWLIQRLSQKLITRETENWYRGLHAASGPEWASLEENLAAMKALAVRHEAEFILSIFPLFHRLENYPFRGIHQKVSQLADRLGIPVIDLLPVFEGGKTQDFWVHPTDFHPNHLAHAKAAAHLEKVLISQTS